MNALLRNIIITLAINVVIFIIGWGCIVPDTVSDNTHLFGLVGDVEIVRGNTSTVFGMCAILSTLTLIVSLVEAIIEDYRPCCPTRFERPKKSPKISGMRVEPTPEKEAMKMKISDPTPEKVDEDKDPKTPTMD